MYRILIVEDEQAMLMGLRDNLEFEGYQIEEAENGMDALKLLREQSFDLVFCDIKMPQLDGLELLSKIKEEGIKSLIIMISGHYC